MARSLPAPLPAPPGGGTWRGLMEEALRESAAAPAAGEAPVGAILIDERGNELARAHNAPIATSDPTAHAEILCPRRAAQLAGNYRLPGSVLIVTLEPCLMCLGAILHARVAGVVYGAPDPRAGALVSNLDGAALPFVNHHPWVLGPVLQDECAAVLKRFFLARRRG